MIFRSQIIIISSAPSYCLSKGPNRKIECELVSDPANEFVYEAIMKYGRHAKYYAGIGNEMSSLIAQVARWFDQGPGQMTLGVLEKN